LSDANALDSINATEADLRQRLRYIELITAEKFRARDLAVNVAIEALDFRLNGMNEFRDTLRDQATRFVTREEYLAAHATLERAVQASQIALSKLSAQAEENDKSSAS
jgi:hypothetical protein